LSASSLIIAEPHDIL